MQQKKWIFLKVSSVILIPLMIWFIINLALIYDKEYLDVVSFFSTQPSKFLTSLLMIVAFFYLKGWLSLSGMRQAYYRWSVNRIRKKPEAQGKETQGEEERRRQDDFWIN